MCLPKIYMNASQYEEVKDGGRGVRGHAETKPKNGVLSLLAGGIKRKRGSTWSLEVMFVSPSPRGSLASNQSLSRVQATSFFG